MVKTPLKGLITGVLFLFFSTTLFATDYYWVGGTGSWTDLTHWATTSGGAVKHTVLPGAADNVFFDANSFTAAGQVVTITNGATCRNMNWTGVTNSPEIYSFFDDLSIYGSLTLPASVERNFLGNMRFKATSGSHTIDLDNLPLSTSNNEIIYIEGAGGTWALQDALTVYRISITAGTFNTNNFAVNCSIFGTSGTNARSISLGSSAINCPTWDIASATGLTFNAGTSTITSSFRLTGGGLTYNNLVIDGTSSILNSNTFNTITLNAASVLKLTQGTTQTFATLVSNGTSANPVSIQSTVAGSAATLAKSGGGTVTISYAQIQDNTATGGTFTANNSVNLGNVTGWNIPVIEPTTQVTAPTITGATTNTIYLRWTNGNGSGRIVLARAASAVNTTPADFTAYTAGAYGTTQVGTTGNYVVYSGNSNTATITGLTPGTTYHFAVFEFNGSGATTNYLTTTPAIINETTLPSSAVVISTSNVSVCSGKFYPSRGIQGYNSNENFVQVLTPLTPGTKVRLSFTDIYIGSGDVFKVYDGANTSAAEIPVSTTSPGVVTATNASGQLTIQFTSDNFVQGSWEADISCFNPNAEPTTGASNLTFSAVTSNSMTLNWTPGDGANRIIVARATSAVANSPTDGTVYTASTTFGGSPSFFFSEQSVVYNGTGSTTTVTGLLPNTTYHFAIFEYNGTTAPNYRATGTTGNRVTGAATLATQPTTSASNVTFTNKTASSMTLNWTNGNGARRVVIARAGTATVPTNLNDGNDYTASATYGSGTMIGGTGFVVYNGTGNSVTVTGLAAQTTYSFAIIEYNGTGTTANYFTPGTAAGSAATLIAEPTTPSSSIIVTGRAATTININWTKGNGERRLVIVRQGSPVSVVPADGAYYTTSTDFSTATDLGGGNKVMYSGAGDGIWIGGLTPLTTYHIAIFEFNGSAVNATNYLATAATVSATTIANEPTVGISNIKFSNTSFTSFTVQWTNGNGARRLVAVKDYNSGGSASPADGTSYATSTTFGQGAMLATDFYAVYDGTGNSVTVTGLTPGRFYSIYVWEYNGTGTSVNYYTTTSIGFQSTLLYKPTLQATELAVTATTANSATLSWKRGNGNHCMVVARAGAPVSFALRDSVDVTSSGTAFGQGTDLGNGNVVVAVSASTTAPVTATITNLNPNTTYHFAVIEYNRSGSINYFLTDNAPQVNTTTTAGANYYWVGGNGNWSDFANHWATQSGGTVFHSKAPGSADNVYFDANSFSEDNQKVTVDQNVISCRDMDWSGVTRKVSFSGTSTCSLNLSVFGSLKLSTNLSPAIGSIAFRGSAPGNVIDMGGRTTFSSSSCGTSVYFDGYQGEWLLKGDVSATYMYLSHGTLRAENSKLNFSSVYFSNPESPKTFDLGNSTLTLSSWGPNGNLTVIGGTLVFDTYYDFPFNANGATFKKVIIRGNVDYPGRIYGGGTIETLDIVSGKKVYFESGKTFNLNELIVKGDTSRTTIIGATEPGVAAIFHKATGSINVDYVQLKDNQATGGAQFNATNSADGGNVTGWNITNPPIYLPKISASAIIFTRVFTTELKMKWVNGDGTARLVVAKENTPSDRYPENGKTYAGNNTYGSGSDIGNGNFVIYNGVRDTLTVKGLTPGKRYHFAIYEYNAWNNQTKYRVRGAVTENTTTPGTADIIMSNTPATVCNVKYFDEGGNGIYTQAKSFTQTLTPSTPGSKLGIVFSSFETNSYDSLYIYDGATTTAPILGRFASQKRPTGPIIAQNAAGVLTFRLDARTSPSSSTYAGWQAELFCVGTPVAEPTAQASALTVSEETGSSLRVKLSKGNGSRRVIIARAGNAVNRTPVDGTDFTGSATFGDGTSLGEGNYIVYSGDGDDVTVLGLRGNTTYHFSAFEYNGTGSTTNYLAANPATGNGLTPFTTPTEASYSLTFPYVSSDNITLSFGSGNGSNKLVVVRKGAPVNFIPVDGTFYEHNKDLGSDTRVIYNGTSSSFISAYNLVQATEYHFAIFEFNGTDTKTKYLTTSFLTGKQTTKGPVFYLGKVNASYCPNSTITAKWNLWNGSFSIGNEFSLQLSDENGNFNNPMVLKDTSSYSAVGTIVARIPNTIKGGTGYKLRIVSSNPVAVSDSIRTIAIPVVPDVTFTVEDSTFVSSSAINNQWLRNGVPIPGATQQSFRYEDGGRYTVRVTENGCYKVAPEFVVTSNEETVFGRTVKVYPNPATATLVVESPEGSDGSYVIRDIHGKAVAAGSLTRNKDQVDVSALTPGVYLIRVTRDGRSVTKVFIKE